jgi:glycosyltransferase involved in cell wall biosynthesis
MATAGPRSSSGTSNRKPRILFLAPRPYGTNPSQRFRFEQYLPILEARGYEVREEPFLDEATVRLLSKPGHTREKVGGVLRGFARRMSVLRDARDFDFVFIHLEAAPVGPPIIEAVLFAMGKPVIYDIDDVMFVAKTQRENRLAAPFRFRSKVAWTAKRARTVIGVNPFLVEWAGRHNRDTRLIPTTIDPARHRPAPDRSERGAGEVVRLGWTGSKTTAPYLDVAREALAELDRTRDFTLRVICDHDPGFKLKRYEFVPWREKTEIEDLWPIDVGIMPVKDDIVAKGKVGFKAIQFSALEIPCVVSDVGSGREVVEDGVTGLVVPNTVVDWVAALRRLIDDPALRRRMGCAARERVLATYSVPAQTPNYLSLFEDEGMRP